MAGNEAPDRMNLLEHAASIAGSIPRYESSRAGYEMVDVDTSDIGTHKASITSQYPPSYSATWDGDLEQVGKNGESYNLYSPALEIRSPTYTSHTSSKPKNAWQSFLRFIRRSGRYGSPISYEPANPTGPNEPRKFSGWRGGCLAAAVSASIVLLINLIFTVWAASTTKSGTRVGTIYEGECSSVRKADSWLHIAINAMGTILLGASNYTMQCLSSPTRSEVDVAHSKGRYLDIGLPSLRNLNGRKKKLLFAFLVLSTLPLHFLWNSAIFTTAQSLDYNVFVVTPNFFNQTTVDCSQNASIYNEALFGGPGGASAATFYSQNPLEYGTPNNYSQIQSSMQWWQADVCNISQALLANSTGGTLSSLTNEDCINAYGPGNANMKGWGNVLVVTKDTPANTNRSILLQFRYEGYVSNYTGDNWVCDPDYLIANNYKCNYRKVAANSSSWTLGPIKSNATDPYVLFPSEEWPIDYCLAQDLDLTGKCQLQYSLVIMICVLIANTIKLSCMLYILITHLDPVLATIGDGIASFLERPDPVTASSPFLDRQKARKFEVARSGGTVRWKKPKRALRWWNAPSRPRWFITLSLCSIAILVVSLLLSYGNNSLMNLADGAYSSPYAIGFGTYNSDAVLNIFSISDGTAPTAADFSSNGLLLSMVAVANLPQMIVSCLYFAYNTVYTSMVSADEWSRFTTHRKALRTTDPKGEQRSTYWLSLPWTYALPLAIASSVLHWLISQSLFIARTEILDTYGQPEALSYMEVGYSPLAILLALLFGTGMVLGMILNGFRKLRPCVLVGNNSLAIAAACQRPEKDVGAQLRKVQWGAVSHEVDGKPGHCCFTSEDVESPRLGDLYM